MADTFLDKLRAWKGSNAGHDALAVQLERRLPLTFVTLRGMLSMQQVARVRNTLIKGLAECPDAVIMDVAELEVDSDLPLAVFRAVARHASNWPAVPVMLVAPPPDIAERMARTGMDRTIPVFSTAAMAAEATAVAPSVARADQELTSGLDAPKMGRALTTEICLEWNLTELLDAACLIVSELVTNAFIYTDGQIRFSAVLRYPNLHLVVRDNSPHPPTPRAPTPGDKVPLSGRGLQLIEITAHSWGYIVNDTGKAVWAILRCPETARQRSPNRR